MAAFNFDQPAYRDLRDRVAERTDSLVAWLGSGLSTPAGLPTWSELKTSLLSDLDQKAKDLDEAAAKLILAKRDHAAYEPNPWLAFEVLKDGLGDSSFAAAVRKVLSPATTAPIPDTYTKLWKLRLGGVLNLNLDRLATRAHNSVALGTAITEFVGNDARDFLHVLQSANPFIANLHGVTDQVSSWVFTNGQLRNLLRDKGYQTFITACLAARTIIFIGIGADDVAAGGHSAQLRDFGIQPGHHFWITSRQDAKTDGWAEHAGIRVIRYSAPKNNHSALQEALDDLIAYVAKDTVPPPVVPSITLVAPSIVPPPDKLKTQDAETIRRILNAEAARILNSPDVDRQTQYADFRRNYRSAIYRAWEVTHEEPDNVLFGYKLTQSLAAGAFGHVYLAESPKREEVAIKVLHGEVRNNPEMLESFRRGVNSMRILSRRNVKGMVAYREASEIPACAIMDYVEGPNLVEAVTSHLVADWASILKIGLDLATILRSAHQLPERVLHRDVKPANVMLQGFHTATHWQVLVLDFDLSWHKDAMGLSIDTSKTMSGFLAPEQLNRSTTASTRNALVDSFGLGMTLYYLRSAKEPVYSQQKHADWRQKLSDNISVHQCPSWKSLPRRFARLIEWSTRDSQAERWDMSQIKGELSNLRQAYENPTSVVSAELLAEELAARSYIGKAYTWSRDILQAKMVLSSGVTIAITGKESERMVDVDISWIDQGYSNRKNVGRWIPTACDQAASKFKPTGFATEILSRTAANTHIRATIPVHVLNSNVDSAAAAVSNALECFTFS